MGKFVSLQLGKFVSLKGKIVALLREILVSLKMGFSSSLP